MKTHVPRESKQHVCRSKSSSGTAPMAAAVSSRPSPGEKQRLRKYNSFPFQEVLFSDLGYSSEESVPSPYQLKRASQRER